MDHFYVTLSSDSSDYFFPCNTVANFRKKNSYPDWNWSWQMGGSLVEISYPKGYKKRLLHNVIYLDWIEIKFPVRNYKSLYDTIVSVAVFLVSSKKEKFITIFSGDLNKYFNGDGFTTELCNTCYGENVIQNHEKLVSHFSARMYGSLDDSAKTVMIHTNCLFPEYPCR